MTTSEASHTMHTKRHKATSCHSTTLALDPTHSTPATAMTPTTSLHTSSSATRYDELVLKVAKRLLSERGYSQRHIAGESTADVRDVVQQLLVMRPPPDDDVRKSEEALYKDVDELLKLEQARQPVVDAFALPTVATTREPMAQDTHDVSSKDLPPLDPHWRQISLWKGDITTLNATAIVNAANSALLGCFQPTHKCIDNVIHCKAGPRLRTACHDIMTRQITDEPVGDAKLTPAFALPSMYVIHTVGPQLRRGHAPTTLQRHQLQQCYARSLDMLLETVGPNAVASIAFPCISTGLFAFPSDVAVPLVLEAVLAWLRAHPEARQWRVVFNTFLQSDYDLYKRFIETQHHALRVPAAGPDPVLSTASALVQDADYLLITAGAGLSAAAGLDYTSEAVMQRFHPTMHRQGLRTMYHMVGRTDLSTEFFWGYYFHQINVARLTWSEKHRTAPTYSQLKAIRDRFERRRAGSTFVATTNADGMFAQESFPFASVYTMQGDYGLIQCKTPCSRESVFDIAPFVARGLEYTNAETYVVEDARGIPSCPRCGGEMSLCLRLGPWFLESWFSDQKRAYRAWLRDVLADVETNGKKLVVLELGVGFNTPGILRLPDERLAASHANVSLVRVNEAHPDIPFRANGVGVRADANTALAFLHDRLGLADGATDGSVDEKKEEAHEDAVADAP